MDYLRTEILPILLSVLFVALDLSISCLDSTFSMYKIDPDSGLFSRQYSHAAIRDYAISKSRFRILISELFTH